MSSKIKVSIIGATGFTGRELVRMLNSHDEVEIANLYSATFHGKKISEVYQQLTGIADITLKESTPENFPDNSDVVFLALPHTASFEYIKKIYDSTSLIIDLSADYRFNSAEIYESWYNVEHLDKERLNEAVYGLPEINRKDIKGKKLVANPGCYATAVILAIYPLLAEKLIDGSIYVDAKSGVSGAGRKLDNMYLFSNVYENLSPYNVNKHRHMPEIIEFLETRTGEKIDELFFCPQLLPVDRGILANCYLKVKDKIDYEKICRKYYGNEEFITVKPEGKYPCIKDVNMTNNCELSAVYNSKTNSLSVMSAIDNLIKGASGQAIQNMNVALGLKEDKGLK